MKNHILANVFICVVAVLTSLTGVSYGIEDYWDPQNLAKHQCTSVYLGYMPEIAEHHASYNEAVVEKSASGSFFVINSFTSGYIGVMERDVEGKSMRYVVFSVWDVKCDDENPRAAPESERAILVQKGENVIARRFAGQGTGGKSTMIFPWKEGQRIRTLVIEKQRSDDFRQISGYVYLDEQKAWSLLSCWRVQAIRTGLGSSGGYIEDLARDGESRKNERRMTLGPAYRYYKASWHPVKSFRFSRDGNSNRNINCRLNPQLGYYSIATGGGIKESDFTLFKKRTIDPLPPHSAPDAAVQALIDAPSMEGR